MSSRPIDWLPSDACACVLLFDGSCGVCNRLVTFIVRRDRRACFYFASLQGAAGRGLLARTGRSLMNLTTLYIVSGSATARPTALERSRALFLIAASLGWPWNLLLVFRIVPAALLDRCYDFLSRYRYRVAGRQARCPYRPPAYGIASWTAPRMKHRTCESMFIATMQARHMSNVGSPPRQTA